MAAKGIEPFVLYLVAVSVKPSGKVLCVGALTVVSGALSGALAYTLGFDAEAAWVPPAGDSRQEDMESNPNGPFSVCRRSRNKRPSLSSPW